MVNPKSNMGQLKALLLEEEQSRIEELAENLSSLSDRTEALSEKSDDLRAQADALYRRTGTDENMRRSVAAVIDGALRDAEVDRHRELSRAMAPVVVHTIRSEIGNQREEMVQALYPITGRLVQTYVANAFRSMMVEVNQKLEGGLSLKHWGFRVRSWITGIPYRDLVLRDIRGIKLEELYLIRRGSGELMDYWVELDPTDPELETTDPHDPDARRKALENRKDLVSGFLTAIIDFAREAFANDRASLRTLDLGRDRLYLRASPAYIIAAKCQGPAKPFMEQVLDEEFLNIMERYNDALSTPLADNDATDEMAGARQLKLVLPNLAENLAERIREREEQRSRSTPLAAILVLLLGLLALGWIGYQAFLHWKRTSLQAAVEQIIDDDPVMRSYPTEVSVGPNGRSVSVFGLAPDFDAKDGLVDKIKVRLANTGLRDEVAVLPGLKSQEELRKQLANVAQKVEGVETEIANVETNIAVTATRDVVQRNTQRAKTVAEDLERLRNDQDLSGESTRIAALTDRLAQIQQAYAKVEERLAKTPSRDELKAITSSVASLSARLDSTQSATESLPLQAAVKSLSKQVATLSSGGLADWVRRNAIFFSTGTQFKDDRVSGQRLDELAKLMKDSDRVLRVIGYTDGQGSNARNQTLSQNRANRVVEQLRERDVPEARMVAIGRGDSLSLTTTAGERSANRRVEFELGFRDEVSTRDARQ